MASSNKEIPEKLIREIQRFLNTPFKYSSLDVFLDKQRAFLLQVQEKIEDNEYNALWDVIGELQKKFSYAKDHNLTIGFAGSVLLMYDFSLKQRNSAKKISLKYEVPKERIESMVNGIKSQNIFGRLKRWAYSFFNKKSWN